MTGTFDFHGHTLGYYDHPANTTRVNERAVELPIARAWVGRLTPSERSFGMEFGNVLTQYGLRPPAWPTLDLYEPDDTHPMIREDARTWLPPYGGFAMALCTISTLEHVGWDDDHDPTQAPALLDRVLARWLIPNAPALITWPMGWHPALDRLVCDGATGATRVTVYQRAAGPDGPGADEWIPAALPVEVQPYIGGGKGCQTLFVGEFGRLVL